MITSLRRRCCSDDILRRVGCALQRLRFGLDQAMQLAPLRSQPPAFSISLGKVLAVRLPPIVAPSLLPLAHDGSIVGRSPVR